MSNKYLEKIAGNTSAVIGAVLGASIGGALGYLPKKKAAKYNIFTGVTTPERDKTKGERIREGLYTASMLGAFGAFNGYLRGSAHGSAHVNPGNLAEHFKDMGMTDIPKTKAEATRFYKLKASSYHPDRAGGSSEKMQKLNSAWTKAKAHHDFEKMASMNKYLRIM